MMDSTDWSRYDVPAMWSMVEDLDTDPQWRHVSGWRKAFELTSLHLTRMLSYREQLAAAWPPERNDASRVYLAELDKLIVSVRATYDAAIANHEAMSAATATIAAARHELKPLYEQWRSNESTLAGSDAALAAAGSGRPAPAPGPSAASADWRASLNDRARALMDTASADIALASYRLTRPPDYIAPRVGFDAGTERPATDKVGGLVAPMIPPIVPRPAPAGRVPATPSPTGPVLTGRQIGSLPPPPPAPVRAVSAAPQPGIAVPAVIGPVVARPPLGSVPANVGSAPGTVRQVTSTLHPSSPGAGPPPGAVRPLPPGGVIGAHPGMVLGPTSGGRPVQRPNPIGGVIGPRLATGGPAPSGRGGPPRPVSATGIAADRIFRTPDGHVVTISDRTSRPHGARRSRDGGDPDNPWATADGVDPVVEPAPEPRRHGPGPAIGLDR